MTEREILLGSALIAGVLFSVVALYVIGGLATVLVATAAVDLLVRRHGAGRAARAAEVRISADPGARPGK